MARRRRRLFHVVHTEDPSLNCRSGRSLVHVPVAIFVVRAHRRAFGTSRAVVAFRIATRRCPPTRRSPGRSRRHGPRTKANPPDSGRERPRRERRGLNTQNCRYLMPRARVQTSRILLHTFGSRCTASPAVGGTADGSRCSGIRAVAAPNGTTERQHRITGDALAEVAPNGIDACVRLVVLVRSVCLTA